MLEGRELRVEIGFVWLLYIIGVLLLLILDLRNNNDLCYVGYLVKGRRAYM